MVGLVVLAVAAAGTTYSVLGRRAEEPATAGPPSPPVTRPSAAAGSSGPPGDKRMLAEIDAVLKTRASAVRTGQLAQFLQHLDPQNSALRRRHQQLFGNLRKLGLRHLSYRREGGWVPEPQPQHGSEARAFRVMMLVQVTGIDPAPRFVPLGYTFAERGGRWLLVDDDDLAGEQDRGTYREPWDLGPIEAVRGPGVLVVVPANERANGRRLVGEARRATPAVRAALKRSPAGVLVIAMADQRSMDTGWQTGGHPAAAVAVQNFSPVTAAATRFEVTGSRVVINPTERTKADRFLLAHEFTHAAMAPLGGKAPTWLVEGLAEYVEFRLTSRHGDHQRVADRRRTLLRQAIPAVRRLPTDNDFRGAYDEQSYGVSWIVVEYLADEYGISTLNALYADLARGPEDAAARERALRQHLDTSEAELVAAVKEYDG
ncbi:hypothetical protein [Kribbella flavida]|nr:hypothetical protein [Kribbella flavida]